MRFGFDARVVATEKPTGRVGIYLLRRFREFGNRLGGDQALQLTRDEITQAVKTNAGATLTSNSGNLFLPAVLR